jgi:hypothetical protein
MSAGNTIAIRAITIAAIATDPIAVGLLLRRRACTIESL